MAGAVIIEKLGQEDIEVGVGAFTRTNPAGGSMTAHKMNLASFAIAEEATEQVWDPGLCTPGVPVYVDVVVPGAQLGDFADASFTGAWNEALILHPYVYATDTVRVVIHNIGAAYNPGSGTLRVLVFRTA